MCANLPEEECRICRITNAYRSAELRDFGKNHSDCRFLVPFRLSHYHREIPGYGNAVDFDLPAHSWNCAGLYINLSYQKQLLNKYVVVWPRL